MNKRFNFVRQKAKKAAAALALLPTSALVMAQSTPTIPDATTQLSALTTSIGGYATTMFGIALAAVGIMVGVKWIKRGKSAA